MVFSGLWLRRFMFRPIDVPSAVLLCLGSVVITEDERALPKYVRTGPCHSVSWISSTRFFCLLHMLLPRSFLYGVVQ